MRIDNRLIGAAQPPYIIAEIGVNHDGDPRCALELVDAAAGAGADAVKLQYFQTDLLMSGAARLAAYQAAAGETDPLAMLRRLELGLDDLARICQQARQRGLHAIVTIFSLELVAGARELPWDAFKTASPDIIHRPLLSALAADERPLIVSTGASELEEVARALEWLAPARDRLALLQCVSAYPAPEPAFDGIGALGAIFDGPVGYSDHNAGTGSAAGAIAAGAVILEKHLTYDRAAAGPDHAASLEPAQFAEYVRLARAMRPAPPAPSGRKQVLPCERDVRAVSRQSITTTRPIAPGEVIQRRDLTFKRPGTGLAPWRLGEVLGRRAARAIETDAPLAPEDLA
ncbi:MAG: N-acetylneuraminate synthase family protein [Phycisphaerales bacterium JB039]